MHKYAFYYTPDIRFVKQQNTLKTEEYISKTMLSATIPPIGQVTDY